MLPRKHCNEMFDSKEASFVAITINNFPTAERQRAMEVTLVGERASDSGCVLASIAATSIRPSFSSSAFTLTNRA